MDFENTVPPRRYPSSRIVLFHRVLTRVLRVLARLVGWGLLGLLCAWPLAFMSIPLHIPASSPDVPEDSLANEWVTPAILVGFALESLGGLLAGSIIALAGRTPRGRRRMFGYAFLGATVCLGLDAAWYGTWWLLGGPDLGPSPGLLAYPLFHGLGVLVGLCYAFLENHDEPLHAGVRTTSPAPPRSSLSS